MAGILKGGGVGIKRTFQFCEKGCIDWKYGSLFSVCELRVQTFEEFRCCNDAEI